MCDLKSNIDYWCNVVENIKASIEAFETAEGRERFINNLKSELELAEAELERHINNQTELDKLYGNETKH